MSWLNIEDKRANNRMWQKRIESRWRKAGCCIKCGLPVKRFVKCLDCRQKHVQYVLASRRRCRAAARKAARMAKVAA